MTIYTCRRRHVCRVCCFFLSDNDGMGGWVHAFFPHWSVSPLRCAAASTAQQYAKVVAHSCMYTMLNARSRDTHKSVHKHTYSHMPSILHIYRQRERTAHRVCLCLYHRHAARQPAATGSNTICSRALARRVSIRELWIIHISGIPEFCEWIKMSRENNK